MNKILKTLSIALMIVGTACTSQAQDDEKKIKIKISKQVDGETKIFEGEYKSEEEMLSDPAYREFAGENEFHAFFGDDEFNKIIQLHKGAGAHAFSFGFDDDETPMRHLKHFDFDHGGPGVFMFDDDNAMGRIQMFDSKEYEEKLEQKMKELEEKMKGLDKTLQEEIMESMREIEELNSGLIPRMTRRGGITVEDVGSDFGKRGLVEDKDRLELDDINYMVMQKRLNLRFGVTEEGALSVKISNEAGTDIYNRYFEKFSGTFSDQIDFNKYSSGKYLLEISNGRKRLTKKLVID